MCLVLLDSFVLPLKLILKIKLIIHDTKVNKKNLHAPIKNLNTRMEPTMTRVVMIPEF